MNAFFSLNTFIRWASGGLLVLASLLVGCDDSGLTDSAEESATTPLPPNIEFQLSFDETTTTYSSVFPSRLVRDIGKGKSPGNVRYMTNFVETEEARSFTDEGFLKVERAYTGGHPTMNMPKGVHNELREHMPFDPNDANPISRFELTQEGKITYYRENGKKEWGHVFDPEKFKVDPSVLDSLQDLEERSVSMQERVEMSRQSLRSRGLSLRRLDAYRVQYDREIEKIAKLSRAEMTVDLRYGKPVHMTYYRTDGKVDFVETRAYRFASGYPVMTRSVVYQYGESKGDWTVTSRTETHRENIKAVFATDDS